LKSKPMERANLPLRLVTFEEYLEFVRSHREVTIEDTRIRIGEPYKIRTYQPKEFSLETTTVWSFPARGDWATHKGDYRGNWAPQVVRNLIIVIVSLASLS